MYIGFNVLLRINKIESDINIVQQRKDGFQTRTSTYVIVAGNLRKVGGSI